MKLYFMKQKELEMLQSDIAGNLSHYQHGEAWVDQYFADKETPRYFFDTGIEVDDNHLVNGGPETDGQNARIVFEAYKDKINPLQASDLRMWAQLAHCQHWEYMSTRWRLDIPDDEDDEPQGEGKKSAKEKAMERVKTRYFFGASTGKAFVRQGIARLYWGAYLTYDEHNENPYEYTEYFFNKQDVFTSITERSYARNKTFVLAVLKELKKYPNLSREDIRLYLARLNQAGAITVLDYLDADKASELCANVMDEVHRIPMLREGSTLKAYNDMSGKEYGFPLKIIDGKVTVCGKPIKVKPQNLIGKKEGSKIVVSGQTYVIKEFS